MRLAFVSLLAACSFPHGTVRDGDAQMGESDGPMRDGPAPEQFAKRKPITIDRALVGKTGAPPTLAGYPMLYSVTDPALALRPTGDVFDAEGDDIVFADAGGATLAHEIELYDPLTGRLVAWVNVPLLNTITATTNTTIYIYYGDDQLTTSTQQPALVWDDAFEAVWHMNENPTLAPPQIKDRTSHGRSGTAMGTAAADGLVAGALAFDGVDDAVRIGTWTQLTNASFTLEVWVRPETTQLGQEVALGFHKSNANQQSIHMRVYDDGGVRFSFWGQDLGRPAGAIAYGQWNHFVGTYNNANDASRLYLAGVQAATGNQGPFTAVDGAGSIGAWDGCSPCDQFFKGLIDEVRVSSVERTVHWISTTHANINDPGAFAMTGPAEDVP
ncbi:MAG TPA: DUF2341 domain-containing protein [Kofleriaceae bacterium]